MKPFEEGQSFGEYVVDEVIQTQPTPVCTALDSKQEKVVLKLIRSELDPEEFRRESQIALLLDYPNSVRTIDVLQLPGQVYCLVQQYIKQASILKAERLAEEKAKWILRELVQATDYFHSNAVYHGDLRPGAVLVNDSMTLLRITNFGVVNLRGRPSQFTHYTAPEVMMQEPVTSESDIWSLGVILFVLLTGNHPWEGRSFEQQMFNAARAEYNLPFWLSEESSDLISKMLVLDPKKRITLTQIREHPFIAHKGGPLATTAIQNSPSEKTSSIEHDILESMRERGFTLEEVVSNILHRESTSTGFRLYYLLRHQKMQRNKRSAMLSKISRSFSGMSDLEASPSGSPLQSPGGSPKSSPRNVRKSISFHFFRKGSSEDLMKGIDFEGNLRVSKDSFPREAVSILCLSDIKKELERAFELADLSYTLNTKGNKYTCKVAEVRFKAEICRVSELEGIKGIKFKRQNGYTYDYQAVYEKIIGALRL